MKLIVKPLSGINGDGFEVICIDNNVIAYNRRYYYGYDASWSKSFATKDKPFVSDILKDLCRRAEIDFNSIEIEDGLNVFNEKPIKGEKFYNDYVKNICES